MELPDIGQTVPFSAELLDNSTKMVSAEVVGVAGLEKHKTCFQCKGRVEPLDSGLGRCTKEDCQMLQKYAVCPEHQSASLVPRPLPRLYLAAVEKVWAEAWERGYLSATLMFRTAAGLVSLHTFVWTNTVGDRWSESWRW